MAWDDEGNWFDDEADTTEQGPDYYDPSQATSEEVDAYGRSPDEMAGYGEPEPEPEPLPSRGFGGYAVPVNQRTSPGVGNRGNFGEGGGGGGLRGLSGFFNSPLGLFAAKSGLSALSGMFPKTTKFNQTTSYTPNPAVQAKLDEVFKMAQANRPSFSPIEVGPLGGGNTSPSLPQPIGVSSVVRKLPPVAAPGGPAGFDDQQHLLDNLKLLGVR